MEEPTPVLSLLDRGRREVPAREGVERCRTVFVDRSGWGRRLPYWRVVQRGVVGDVRFLYTSPSPCLLVPSTRVEYTVACEYSERELTSNVLIVERCDSGKVRRYAYPKRVWRELKNLYLEPLARGEEAYNTGVILIGPPGTGKSRLAQIAARYVGVSVYTVDTSILSRWVGESERNLRRILDNARESQPSVIILDDAEWLLIARNLAASVEGTAGVRMDLQQILFETMQEIYDNGERVLFIASTNFKKEGLDPALIRHGRFGPPLFVPLPDYEAAKIILRDQLPDKSEEEIERLAFKVVNAGLSVADILGLADKIRRGEEPEPEPVGGRGYARIFVEPVEGFERLEREYKIPLSRMLSTKSRLNILGDEDIATAFATQIAYSAKKSVVKITDALYLDEAIHMANMLEAVLIVPTRLNPQIQYYINDNASVPIILVGQIPPVLLSFHLGSVTSLMRRVGIEPSVRAVASFIGKKPSKSVIEKIKRKTGGDYEMVYKVLEAIITTGQVSEDALEHIIAWM